MSKSALDGTATDIDMSARARDGARSAIGGTVGLIEGTTADIGGIARIIRDKRLDAAYREIAGGAKTSRSITEVALLLGFSNSSQFTRAFHRRFAMTPSEARQTSMRSAA